MTGKMNSIDPEWTRRQVEEYKRRYKNYKLFAEVLESVLKQVALKLAPLAIVQTRPKSIASFAEKCQRKRVKYDDPLSQFTDLCGGRIIVHTADEVRAISGFIEQHFEIDQENTIDVSQRLKPTEFGYRSVHYIISFKPGLFPNKDVPVDVEPLLSDDKKFPNRRAEIQVRTILEHAWADMSHDLAYKSSFQIPARWSREFAGLAAMLEGADKTFSKIKEGLRTYASCYGAYMNEEQMQAEIKMLEIILDYDQENAELAGRIGKLAITLGDWSKAVDVLYRYTDSGNLFILRDMGIALCKMHRNKPGSPEFRKGQQYLERACEPPNEDVDAISSLAGTWKNIDEEKARRLYRQAFQLDQSDPYPLENYLDLEVSTNRDVSIVSILNPVIFSAIQRCRNQAGVGVNLPWAYYMMGKFYLLLNKPYESLEAYAKAIQLSSSTWVIDTSIASVERIKVIAGELSGYEWVRRLLLLGKAVMLNRKAREALNAVERAEEGKDMAEKVKELNAKTREEKIAMENVRELALGQGKNIEGPVVIVAGGCHPSVDEQMKAYRNLFIEAFRDFKGTVIGGGTVGGISGLIGEVGEKFHDSIRTIGYLPEVIPVGATVDRRYTEIRRTKGNGYSPFESLQYWFDLIAGGHDPFQIRVLGINGGSISAFEYRIALALGALVGVVEDSGREVARLLQDEKWTDLKSLLVIPADTMTLSAFIGFEGPGLEAGIRETLAREIHEAYRLAKLEAGDPAMISWEKLPESLKQSNVRQADHIFQKLHKIGCTVQQVTDREIGMISFTSDEIEFLAEIEHGRWNIERLFEGWSWGEEKSTDCKKTPYLVSWSKLPRETREWNRSTVRKIPEFLAKAGLEVRRQS